jgi:hypothetical protein
MKVTIVRGGGIAGMTTGTTLESGALPEADAQTFSAHVQAAALHEARTSGPQTRSPDELLYAISVDDAGGQVVQRFTDATLPDEVRRLVEWVDSRPEAVPTVG